MAQRGNQSSSKEGYKGIKGGKHAEDAKALEYGNWTDPYETWDGNAIAGPTTGDPKIMPTGNPRMPNRTARRVGRGRQPGFTGA
jgi:hypothetical protein